MKEKKERKFIMVSLILFAFIGIMHLLRVFNSWLVRIGLFTVPMWWSYAVIVVSFVMIVWCVRLLKK